MSFLTRVEYGTLDPFSFAKQPMGIIPHQLVLRRMFGLTPGKVGALTTNMGLGSATTHSSTRIIPCSNSNFTGSGCGRYTVH